MPERLRILAMINTLEVGGTEMRLVELARRLPRERFEMHIACMVGTGAYESAVRDAGATIHVIGYRGVRDAEGRLHPERVIGLPLIAWRVAHLLKTVRPDVFHTFLPNCNVFGAAASALTGFRGLVASRVFTSDYRSINPLYPAIENWAARQACRIVCNCEAVRRDVLEREKVDAGRIRVLLNGIDTDRFSPCVEGRGIGAARQELGLPEGGAVVGIVANLLPHKRHEDFVSAAGEVAKEFPDAQFAIIGRPYNREGELHRLAEKLGIARQVHFFGARGGLEKVYPLFDVLVSTSTEEGLSNALLEGQSCGIPVVATAIAGTPEIVADGETGFLVPALRPELLAEKVKTLLGDPALRRQFGLAAREHILKNFNLDRMVAEYGALYEEVAHRRVC